MIVNATGPVAFTASQLKDNGPFPTAEPERVQVEAEFGTTVGVADSVRIEGGRFGPVALKSFPMAGTVATLIEVGENK